MISAEQRALMTLRIQLYAAMQLLKGSDLAEFWALIDEITQCRDAFSPDIANAQSARSEE